MNTLYLNDLPVKIGKKSVYALSSNAYGRPFTQFDVRCHYQENRAVGAEMLHYCQQVMRESGLNAFIQQKSGISIQFEHFCYYDLYRFCTRAADLLLRMDRFLSTRPADVTMTGLAGWRSEIVSQCAKKHHLAFRLKEPLRFKVKEVLRCWHYQLRDIKDRRSLLNHWPERTDVIFFSPSSRVSLGYLSVMEALHCDYLVVDERENRLGNAFPTALPVECWGRGNRHLKQAIGGLLSRQKWAYTVNACHVGDALHNIVHSVMNMLIPHLIAMHALLEKYPSAIAVAPPNGEVFLDVARGAGHLPVMIQTCSILEYRKHAPGSGLYVLASDADRRYIQKLTHDDNVNISVQGHSYYDHIVKTGMGMNEANDIRTRYGANSSQMILVAGNYAIPGEVEWEVIERLTRMIYRGLAKVSDITVVVKLHPCDPFIDHHQRWAEEAGLEAHLFHVVSQSAILPFIAASDAVVMMQSTIGQEAILLNKPLLDVPYMEDDFKYHRFGASLVAHHADEVARAVKGMLFDDQIKDSLAKGRKRYSVNYFHKQDGLVGQRIAGILEYNIKQMDIKTEESV